MKHSTLLLLFVVFLGGCSAPQDEAPAKPSKTASAPGDEAREAFEGVLASGSNGEITEAAEAFFTVGATERAFAVALSKAQKVESEGALVTYRLWIRAKNPDLEGDGWVQVDVAGKPPCIRSVRTVVLKK